MNMISTGAFQTEMDASSKQPTIAEKFAAVWEKKNAKAARAGGVSLMALSLAACGSDDATTTTATTATTATTTTTTTTTTAVTAVSKVGTTGIDVLTGTTANDTFTFDSGTISAADQVTGSDGTDTVKLYATTTMPATSGVENVEIYSATSASLDLSSTVNSGITSLTLNGYEAVAASIYTIKQGDSISLIDALDATTGTDDVNIAAAATVTSATVNVTNVGVDATNDIELDFTGTGMKTVTINALGTLKSWINIEAATAGVTLTDVVINATSALAITDIDDATTIDASASTGAVSLITAVDAVTITGGSGDDRVDFGTTYDYNALAPDTADGGAGSDTLVLDDADIIQTKAQTAITNFEKIESSSTLAASTGYNLTKFAGVNHFIYAVDSASAATITGTSGLTIETAKAVDDIGANGAQTITLTDAAGAGDVVNLIINDQSGANASDFDFAIANVETINVDASVATVAVDLGLAAAQVQEITVKAGSTAAADVTLAFSSGGTVVTSVDASGTTGLGSMNLTLSTSAVTGATVKGTKNGDDVADGSGADSITFGVGADTLSITGGGADTVDMGADTSNDIVQYDAIVSTGGITITNFDATAEDTFQAVHADTDNAENVISSALASAAALGDNDLTVIDMKVGAAGDLLVGGSEAIADFTDITDVEAYLDEAFSVSAADTALIMLNDGTNSYLYHFLEADNATSIDVDEITLVATFTDAIVLSGDTSVVT